MYIFVFDLMEKTIGSDGRIEFDQLNAELGGTGERELRSHGRFGRVGVGNVGAQVKAEEALSRTAGAAGNLHSVLQDARHGRLQAAVQQNDFAPLNKVLFIF